TCTPVSDGVDQAGRLMRPRRETLLAGSRIFEAPVMNPGKTLVGGVIGAAVAIGIYTVLKTQMQMDAPWFPVVIGILTGLGVRQAQGSAKNISYLRGAVSGVIAAGAMLGAEQVVKMVLTQDTANAAVPQVAAPAGDDADADDGDGAADAEAPAREMPTPKTPITGAVGSESTLASQHKKDEVWPFIFMAVGIFLAYELARGSADRAVADSGGEASEPPPESDGASEEGQA
ncbi:hypothetical protein OAS39_08385, partial [Pirellulales bacterium]|nr:hypothetical protein [Pirellulales bacterium]